SDLVAVGAQATGLTHDFLFLVADPSPFFGADQHFPPFPSPFGGGIFSKRTQRPNPNPDHPPTQKKRTTKKIKPHNGKRESTYPPLFHPLSSNRAAGGHN
ncbi:unnamed protein product, partial [Sphacelaria rigidula]